MVRASRGVPLRTTLRLWLAGAALVSCRNGDMAGAFAPTGAEPNPALATATTALVFYQLSGGQDQYTCGVTTEYRAYCWGRGYRGQLGDGTTATARLTPVPVATTVRFKQVSAGWGHSCGLTPDRKIYCWGDNGIGQLGDGSTDNHYTPVLTAGGHQWRQMDAGTDFTCGITYPDNRAYCWGNNWAGQLGDGTTAARHKPTAVAGGLYFKQVRTGGFHACGITSTNEAYCWGYNNSGRLGDSTNVNRLRPTRVAAGTRRFRQIDAGGEHTCAVSTTDRAFCWGNGGGGALGNGKTSVSYWPRAVLGGLSFTRVSAGNGHSCGETLANLAYCWGYNGYGQVGDGTTVSRLTPVPVGGGLTFAQLTTGAEHTCGKTGAGAGYCWGDNVLGAVGDGTWQNVRLSPVPVAGPM